MILSDNFYQYLSINKINKRLFFGEIRKYTHLIPRRARTRLYRRLCFGLFLIVLDSES